MDRIIRHIKEQLVDLLPDDSTYYRLEELNTWGFPAFIVHRIRVELERNLAESMILPRTEWANMQSETIRAVWMQFVDAIRQEARLPASYAPSVIETAVADVVDMLVQPRKNLPEVIFGADEELTYEQVSERMDAVVVYRHFAELIPRYMQKKGLQVLSRERCAAIIAKADERLTSRYSPLNWAQMLDPLFTLLDHEIDTNLLRLFFEDKDMQRMARQFDRINSTVDRTQLIEILSSPRSLRLADDEEQQKTDAVVAADEKEDEPKATGDKPARTEPQEHKSLMEKEPSEKAKGSKRKRAIPIDRSGEDPIVGAFHKFREALKNTGEQELQEDYTINRGFTGEEDRVPVDVSESSSLNDIFLQPEEKHKGRAEAPVESEVDPQKKEQVMNEFRSKADSPVSEPAEEEPADDAEVRPESGGQANGVHVEDPREADASEPEDTPMWMRFMSPEEIAALEEEEAQDPLDDEPDLEAPFRPEASDTAVDALMDQLDDEQRLFVDKIFRGSEEAYEDALIDIATMDDWRSASRYIDKEIFKRNLVDMYSEVAVDFTDRLHTYFMDKTKS